MIKYLVYAAFHYHKNIYYIIRKIISILRNLLYCQCNNRMKICHFLFEPCTLSRLTTVHNNVTLVRADCVYATVSIYMSSDHLPAVSLYISYCILMEWKYNKIYKEMDFLDIYMQHYVELCI